MDIHLGFAANNTLHKCILGTSTHFFRHAILRALLSAYLSIILIHLFIYICNGNGIHLSLLVFRNARLLGFSVEWCCIEH